MQTACIFGIKPFQLLQRCNLLLELVRDLVVLQKDLDNITEHTRYMQYTSDCVILPNCYGQWQ